MTPSPPPAVRCEHPNVWLTTKALPFGKVSSRLRLRKVSPDLWSAALKLVSLRWHTASPRSNNGSRITVKIRTGHEALISRNYPRENRDSLSLAARGLGPALPGGHGTESIFRKPGNILRGYVKILHSHSAHTSSGLATGRRRSLVAESVFALWIVTSVLKWSNSSTDGYLSGNLTLARVIVRDWPDF